MHGYTRLYSRIKGQRGISERIFSPCNTQRHQENKTQSEIHGSSRRLHYHTIVRAPPSVALSRLVPRASPPPAPAGCKKKGVRNQAPFLHIAKRGIFRCTSIQPSFFFQVYIEPCALRLMHPWFNFRPLFLSTCSMQN